MRTLALLLTHNTQSKPCSLVSSRFGVDNDVDFYALSFVKDAAVIKELKDYLRKHNATRIQARI